MKMCSSVSSSSLCLTSKAPFLFHNRFSFNFSVNPFLIGPRNLKPFSLSASITKKHSTVELSEFSWNEVNSDEYNGWAIDESAQKPVKKNSLPSFLVIGIGTSVAGLLGLLAYASFAGKGFGFRIRSPLNAIHFFWVPSSTNNDIKSEESVSNVSLGYAEVPEEILDAVNEEIAETEEKPSTIKERKLERITVPFLVDSAQQEAILTLKKLKIIEDDAKEDELCTRREYARWLVRANSQLERSRKHQIIPSAALSGSKINAFDDVSIQDQDFEHIQSLAEAGIIKSNLSHENFGSNPSNVEGGVCFNFFPERFISRQDLVCWKAKIEYEVVPGISEEMSRKNIGFLDGKEISSDASVELFVDTLANEKSILRRVFGQSKRLQPNKPCTKAQAAVSLTSGRMTKFIHDEISRLETEYISRQIEIKEIISELLETGKIKQYWEQKTEEERTRLFEAESDYRAAVTALEQEKTLQEGVLAEFLKQRAALDCQKQLLLSLKEEVSVMSEKLSLETVKNVEERVRVQELGRELEANWEGLIDKKSILEAEVEALRILRSWIEDEARKSQSRAKVLEEAEQRWKWNR